MKQSPDCSTPPEWEGDVGACPPPRGLARDARAAGGTHGMAAEGDVKDLKAHVTSYARFISMMKWGTVLALITGFLVILIISN